MAFYVPGQPITAETLETALDRLAVIMSEAPDEGIVYLPIWRRLERELDALRNQNDELAGVRARLARLSRGQTAGRSSANSLAAI
ncbi:hypothetical protein [Devosia ginsengisoli]|uniref:hypothetical protein n=1 Tax=Devosia ginsengisoli TaxID=400770 RepID=UPI0026EB5D0C|nr:hypothetical protein [Devosia ginsengisoli]MCR6672161.1 hypothetical protein [Devosia ginsengisoli]